MNATKYSISVAFASILAASSAMAQPTAELHVVDDDSPRVFVERTGPPAARNLFRLQNTAQAGFEITSGQSTWLFGNLGTTFVISKVGTGKNEFLIDLNGNLTIPGISRASNHINTSSRTMKEEVRALDAEVVLAKLLTVPVSEWRYKDDPEKTKHVGPMAEDFAAALDLPDDKHISTVDADGALLAAVQALHRIIESKDAKIAALEKENSEFSGRLTALEGQVQQIAAAVPQIGGGTQQVALMSR